MSNTFLKAEWRKLLMANYAVSPELLRKYLPYKTELDLWENTCYVSLVGFMFQNTKVMGVKVPFHVNFEEVNLRFYVKYKDGSNWKRGVVFIKELVPKPALSLVANTLYKEHYESLPMQHVWELSDKSLNVEYSWEKLNYTHSIQVSASPIAVDISNGSEEEFITEHYWGYTKLSESVTSEYGVEHPKWKVYPIISYAINTRFDLTYGKEFEFLNSAVPKSVFLAEGSEIEVKKGKKIL